jgi:hypothetical protein
MTKRCCMKWDEKKLLNEVGWQEGVALCFRNMQMMFSCLFHHTGYNQQLYRQWLVNRDPGNILFLYNLLIIPILPKVDKLHSNCLLGTGFWLLRRHHSIWRGDKIKTNECKEGVVSVSLTLLWHLSYVLNRAPVPNKPFLRVGLILIIFPNKMLHQYSHLPFTWYILFKRKGILD